MSSESDEAMDVLKDIGPSSERSDRRQEIRQIVDQIFDSSQHLKSKSVLRQEQVVAAAAAYVIAEELQSDNLRDFVDNLLELEISRGGLGRRNLENVLAAISNREERQDDKGFLRRIFGF